MMQHQKSAFCFGTVFTHTGLPWTSLWLCYLQCMRERKVQGLAEMLQSGVTHTTVVHIVAVHNAKQTVSIPDKST